MLQDTFIFSGNVRENIRYGKPGASEEEVARAAKLAEIYDDIVALPEGFNTYVGERGTLLSGGQKQRISIARIFLKDPPGADSGRGHLRPGQRDGGQAPGDL